MFVVAVHQTPSLTRQPYEEVVRRLTNGKNRFESAADLPFDRLIVHAARQGKNGFCVVDVFESEEAVERFNEAWPRSRAKSASKSRLTSSLHTHSSPGSQAPAFGMRTARRAVPEYR